MQQTFKSLIMLLFARLFGMTYLASNRERLRNHVQGTEVCNFQSPCRRPKTVPPCLKNVDTLGKHVTEKIPAPLQRGLNNMSPPDMPSKIEVHDTPVSR